MTFKNPANAQFKTVRSCAGGDVTSSVTTGVLYVQERLIQQSSSKKREYRPNTMTSHSTSQKIQKKNK